MGRPMAAARRRRAEALTGLRTDGHTVVDVRLPNIFGEHGRPRYNSFVATFVDAVVRGESPQVSDRPVELLHAQDAAQSLIDALTTDRGSARAAGFHRRRAGGARPAPRVPRRLPRGRVPRPLHLLPVHLFNCYRAALFPHHYPVPLVPHTDSRGTFVETVRSRGGEGQSSISTTVPGCHPGRALPPREDRAVRCRVG